jgi:hypothetical protein
LTNPIKKCHSHGDSATRARRLDLPARHLARFAAHSFDVIDVAEATSSISQLYLDSGGWSSYLAIAFGDAAMVVLVGW